MIRTALVACLALSVPALAAADARTVRGEVHDDRRQLRDDLRDARQAGWLLDEFERAAAAHDRRALSAIEARVQRALQAEAREANRETAAAAQDLRRDAPKQGWQPSRDYQDSRSERLADDMHRVDERRDLILEADYRRRIAAIRGEWSALRGQRQRRAMARKHALLEELVRLSRLEIRRDVRELHQDREELREEHHD